MTCIYSDRLFDAVLSKSATIRLFRIEKAVAFVKKHHLKQLRENGEPFYVHPIVVASMVLEHNDDEDTIVASVLHDIVEYSRSVTCGQIYDEFGFAVTRIVEGLVRSTKLDSEKFFKDLVDDFCSIADCAAQKMLNNKMECKISKNVAVDSFSKMIDVVCARKSDVPVLEDVVLFLTDYLRNNLHTLGQELESLSDYKKVLCAFNKSVMKVTDCITKILQKRNFAVASTISAVISDYDNKTKNSIFLIKIMSALLRLQSINCLTLEKQHQIKKEIVEDIIPLSVYLNLEKEMQLLSSLCFTDKAFDTRRK
ncbi:HD domain-containing protein [Candidatus Sneabacter namystus]|uniref:Bifunctional (P)ppGpp synthetase/guanosine-3',5'-bis(Diphosphate) 3'-pyrophosphohydrolase n=1 Tax=Candidatus Sneabacter namystus TaxID=2601646 RepID=A0A5C0UIT6_9RICK|nr:HD domain-containing protein [Candidatus Sneabacter namystus]QEK39423.1 bifunctional (p)ppGpp synthetase/guanosine-3',5'-bis(diphosphate) 3'-pyrophosphohydrolase [Candidatus Sneabacter namystus]